jgi:hypothetical protein
MFSPITGADERRWDGHSDFLGNLAPGLISEALANQLPGIRTTSVIAERARSPRRSQTVW